MFERYEALTNGKVVFQQLLSIVKRGMSATKTADKKHGG